MPTPDNRPRIAAVMLTHNRCARVEEGVDALLHQIHPLDEIIVIDNGSTDGTREMLKQKYNGQITQVRSEENLGSAGGFYEGIRLAFEKGHDWIWVMDDDAKPVSDALKALVESPAFCDPSVGLLASLVLDIKPRDQTPRYENFNRVMAACPDGCGGWIPIGAGHYRRFSKTLGYIPVVNKVSLDSPLIPTEGVGFLGILIRREALSAVGLPLKELFFFWDDLELAYRISRKFKIFVVPSSKIIHRKGGDLQSPRKVLGFSKPGAGAPYEKISRLYYFVRNEIYVRTKYTKPWLAPFVPPTILLKTLGASIFFYDHPFARCKLLFLAAFDGAFGRLGKRIRPDGE